MIIKNLLFGELFKNQKVYFLFSVLLPISISVCNYFYFIHASNFIVESGRNPWLIGSYIQIVCFSTFYPLLSSVLVISQINTERNNDVFKQIYAMPFPRYLFHLIKIITIFFTITFLIFVSFILFNLLGLVGEYFYPEIYFKKYVVFDAICSYFFNLLLICYAFVCIQYLINLFIKPIIYGLSYLIAINLLGLLSSKTAYADYLYFTYPYKNMSNIFNLSLDFISLPVIICIFIIFTTFIILYKLENEYSEIN